MKMKKTFFICLLALNTLLVSGQEKAMLTKEETVNYLKKKLFESNNLKNKDNFYLESYSLRISDCDLSISYSNVSQLGGRPTGSVNHNYKYYDSNYDFNPMQIEDIGIDDASSTADVGLIYITLKAKTGKKKVNTGKYEEKKNPYYQGSPYQDANGKWWDETYFKFIDTEGESVTVGTIYIPFLKSDPLNFNKIKKALEHLRDLCSAEDDPFGE
jgi:hypothetical protein